MHYSAAIDLIDDSATYYTNLSAAHSALKDWPNAVKMAQKAVKLDPGYSKAAYRLGQALLGAGRLREALAAYDAGLRLLPDSQQLLDGRAAAAAELQRAEAAEADALKQIRAIKEGREAAEREAAAAARAVAPQVARVAARPGEPAAGGGAARAGPAGGAAVAELKKALRSRRDPAALFAALGAVGPAALPAVLKSGAEEEELVAAVAAIDTHAPVDDPAAAFSLLEGLSRVPRVGIVAAMLDRPDARRLEKLLLRLHPTKAAEALAAAGKGAAPPYDAHRWAATRAAFGLS